MHFFAQVFLSAGLAISAVGLAASEEPPQIQSFVEFCAYAGANLTDGHWLGAYCRNNMIDEFGYNYTWVDLDFCVGNNGGQLIAYKSGNYSTSCTKCAINHETKTLMLTCDCEHPDKEYSTSSLDLGNNILYDDNGSAGCFDHLGNKTWLGP
ncbi:hypothetical protein C8A00DRAFT_33210 [Chaetomidium leptoderma]|uniref:Cyanovirin-N domain-containing protein n=1 Tax=Chaetomidium leptoderma TaxID=669021 RepID=A0AAN6VMF8_9PEZI|nr:hypothetical protein C8A00DRAFT_33210 [Chaetomidium leptoderma]